MGPDRRARHRADAGWAALRWLGGGASPATSDEYIIAFHDRTHELGARPAIGRLVAAVATLGLGGALGYEGPSLYAGATIGDRVQRRLPRLFSNADHQMLLVAGAAAGIAAIFKAPATGAVFHVGGAVSRGFGSPQPVAHAHRCGDWLPRLRRHQRNDTPLRRGWPAAARPA